MIKSKRWIERSCAGDADAVLVARDNGRDRRDGPDARAVAYVTCHLEPEGAGRIGLVAVSEEMRGRKLGARLLATSVAWFASRGARPRSRWRTELFCTAALLEPGLCGRARSSSIRA